MHAIINLSVQKSNNNYIISISGKDKSKKIKIRDILVATKWIVKQCCSKRVKILVWRNIKSIIQIRFENFSIKKKKKLCYKEFYFLFWSQKHWAFPHKRKNLFKKKKNLHWFSSMLFLNPFFSSLVSHILSSPKIKEIRSIDQHHSIKRFSCIRNSAIVWRY